MPSEEQRLHPLSWLFIAGAWLKGVAVPAVVLLLVSGRGASIWSSYETWSLLLVMPAFAVAFIKFWVFRYTFAPGELVIRDGIVVRNERHIPYDRIQNMDLVQNPLHRMLGVALVRLETAGGDKPEALLRVLSLEAVDRMRAHVFAGRGASGGAEMLDSVDGGRSVGEAELDGDGVAESATDVGPDVTILSMSNTELVKLGLISNRGLVVVAAIMGLAWQAQFDWWNFGDWSPLGDNPRLWESELRELVGRGAADLPAWVQWLSQRSTVVLGATFAVSVLLLFLVFLRLFSIGWHLITLHGYTLRRRGHDLRAEYGLLTKVSATIPTPRIQLLSMRESPLHRWFGRATVQVETAGGQAKGSDVDFEGIPKTAREWLAPLIEADRLAELFRSVLPEIDLEAVEWNPIPQRAWRRIFKVSCVVLIAPVILTTVFLGAWGLVVLILGGSIAYAYARGYTRHAAYALTPKAILYRDGWLVRRMSVVRFTKAQTVRVQSSPFDRRHGMATLRVDTAGAGKVGHKIAIEYLEAEDAEAIRDRLYQEASRTEYRW